MNTRIFKYALDITDTQYVRMPGRSQVLSVAEQNGNLCLWAQVDCDDGWVNRIIEIIGTGNPISMAGLTPEGQWERKFIGTVVMREVSLVWHVFERVSCS